MKISVLQQHPKYYGYSLTNPPSLEYLKAQGEQTLNECLQMLEEAAAEGADLAVTIETVNGFLALGDTRFPYPTVYGGVDGKDAKRFSEAAKRLNMHIVAGLLLTIDGVTYNCAVLFNNRGEIVGIHKKVHLPAGEELHVGYGDRFEVFETEIGNIGMLVCWDLQFPESVRELALGGADLIACPTLGWETTYGLARAYESSVTLAIAMGFDKRGLPEERKGYGDPSCIVDNMGRIIAEAPRQGEVVVTAEIDIKKEPDPQYCSEHFYKSHSMRKTRFSQRRPETYKLINRPLEESPLYNRYFEKKQ
ncbi:MAG: carbon-nitrogen hydrolase family protein [Clostridia bacterium]|nr:carbon-nitrogen hydrolase family protein [Clostridia bacterium]